MSIDFHDIKEMSKIVEKILSDDEKAAAGYGEYDDSEAVKVVKRLVEDDMANTIMSSPLTKMIDQRTLYPHQGKESDGESVFIFEDLVDARRLYDFVIDMRLLEPGEVKLHISEHQFSVHFQPHVMILKPSIFQAILEAYDDFVYDSEENHEAVEALAKEVGNILIERTKVSGAPKKRKKGNPFHDKDGQFSGPDDVSGSKGGSFVSGKTKLKYSGDKKSKGGDKVVHFASTKRPCGRKARRDGRDIRCWDGKKGEGFKEGFQLTNVLKKHVVGDEITDEEITGMIEAIDSVNSMAEEAKLD
jgi:hypothetical protein